MQDFNEGRTEGQTNTCEIVITTGCDCGSASWINFLLVATFWKVRTDGRTKYVRIMIPAGECESAKWTNVLFIEDHFYLSWFTYIGDIKAKVTKYVFILQFIFVLTVLAHNRNIVNYQPQSKRNIMNMFQSRVTVINRIQQVKLFQILSLFLLALVKNFLGHAHNYELQL